MRRFGVLVGLLTAAVLGACAWWLHDRRFGAGFMNDVANPLLLEKGLAGTGRSEIGTIEHVGRRTGIRRLTPVHPEATAEGFRIIVPLGPKSEWARNVVAAGHCRMQLHGIVYELDEPTLLPAAETDGLSDNARWALERLGFMYLRLRRFAEAPGTLGPLPPRLGIPGEPEEGTPVELTAEPPADVASEPAARVATGAPA